MKPFRRVDLRKECELRNVGGYKRPCETLWGLIQPIGCRQQEHVVVKENGKARRGIHTNENSLLLLYFTMMNNHNLFNLCF